MHTNVRAWPSFDEGLKLANAPLIATRRHQPHAIFAWNIPSTTASTVLPSTYGLVRQHFNESQIATGKYVGRGHNMVD